MRLDKFQMKDKVRDTVHGIEGVVMGVTGYANGCVQYLVERRLEDGTVKGTWIDDQQLELVEAANESSRARRGGPRRDVAAA